MREAGGSSACDERVKGEGCESALIGSNVSMLSEYRQRERHLEVKRGRRGLIQRLSIDESTCCAKTCT